MTIQQILEELISAEGAKAKLSILARLSKTIAGRLKGAGLSKRHVQSLAVQLLERTATEQGDSAVAGLRQALAEIEAFGTEMVAERDAKAETLKTLAPHTAISVSDGGREKSVRFIQMNRTRFTAEFPDGEEYSVHVDAFLRVEEAAEQTDRMGCA